MLRFLTAGESHGPALTAIVEGLPAGLAVDTDEINHELQRRQGGYGRGGRQRIERDEVRVLAGLAQGQTIGAPLALLIANRDWENWRERDVPAWTRPRPGHADLPGSIKYGLDDLRLVAERASARETAARVAVGAVCKALLRAVNVEVGSYVEAIGAVAAQVEQMPLEERLTLAAQSDVACPDADAAGRMRAAIDQARKDGDSLGGVIVVVARGVPIGLGSHVQWDRRLDGRIAQALMSIQAIKGVEIGPAFENARLPGTVVHDQLYPGSPHPRRAHNRAGGLEGGMSNGEPIVARIAMKPIPTTVHALDTVDLTTGEPVATQYQRSDVCAVPAAAVVAEAMLAWVLADALLESYGGDRVDALVRRVVDGR
ncbi:MAG: chorismate synthase [Chloroflexi bacterium]|jgi:chorismate synthase|nr:chorismate synthase [Chloroflexota bacterium]